jgi:hypothetical protein
MWVAIALMTSSLAAITGILAIGSGKHWHFRFLDYFRGKRNAILYLWVTASTIFSILHSGVIANYGVVYEWSYRNVDTPVWMALHATMGVLLSIAHFFVAYTLAKEVGPVDKYLWGKHRNAVQ